MRDKTSAEPVPAPSPGSRSGRAEAWSAAAACGGRQTGGPGHGATVPGHTHTIPAPSCRVSLKLLKTPRTLLLLPSISAAGCWCWWLLVSSAAAADCGVRGRDSGQRTPRPRSTGGPAHGTRHVMVTTARRGHVPRGPGVWIWCLHHAHVSAASLPSPGQGPGPPTVPGLELETKIIRIRRYAKISQSQRRPLLGPSPG